MGWEEERNIVHRELDTDREQPAIQVAEIVADLEGTGVDELRPTYDCIDHVLERVFRNPPSSDAQVKITFSYEGYRITVEQDGRTSFVKVV